MSKDYLKLFELLGDFINKKKSFGCIITERQYSYNKHLPSDYYIILVVDSHQYSIFDRDMQENIQDISNNSIGDDFSDDIIKFKVLWHPPTLSTLFLYFNSDNIKSNSEYFCSFWIRTEYEEIEFIGDYWELIIDLSKTIESQAEKIVEYILKHKK